MNYELIDLYYKNILFTDTEDQLSEGDEIQTTPMGGVPETRIVLTKAADDDGIETTASEMFEPPVLRDIMDPYMKVDYTTSSMCRQYSIPSFSWSGASAQNTILGTWKFPDLLLTFPHILDMIGDFRYFKASVKVQIRINGTINLAGAVACCYQPCRSTTDDAQYTDMFTACNNSVALISAQKNTTLEIELPWTAPIDSMDLTETFSNYSGIIGGITLFVLVPLTTTTSSATPTLMITASANFVDPQLMGYTQSGYTDFEDDGFISEGKEAVEKSKSGIISGTAMDISRVAARFVGVPMVGEYAAPVASVLKTASKWLSWFGLDKPNDLRAITRTTGTFDDGWSFGKGLDLTNQLSFDPAAEVANNYDIYGCANYDSFQNYKLLPSLLSTVGFNATANIGDIITSYPVNPMDCKRYGTTPGVITYVTTHLMNLAQYHTFWRGSIKFRIDIFCSAFVSFRLQFLWIPANTVASIPDSVSGDLINMIVDVRGDTTVEFSIPYMKQKLWTRVNTPAEARLQTCPENNGRVYVRLFTPVSIIDPTGSSNIVLVCWKSGGEDFEVMRPRDPQQIISSNKLKQPVNLKEEASDDWEDCGVSESTDNEPIVNVMDIRKSFLKTFQPIIPAQCIMKTGVSVGSEVNSWSEWLHRYTYYTNGANSGFTNIWTDTGTTVAFIRIKESFLFCRGSIRYKMVFPAGGTSVSFQVCNYTPYENTLLGAPSDQTMAAVGQSIEMAYERRGYSVTIPFYSDINFYYRGFQTYVGPNLPCLYRKHQVSEVGTLYVATGDDFTFGFPRAPLSITETLP